MGVGTLIAVVFGLAAAGVAWRRTLLARGHRDVGGFALGATVTGCLLMATVSFVAVPDAWASVYRSVIGVYEGGD
ncbi:MAG: hypothetical protein ACRDZU_03460 [Acidimicrobiales bacterium]